MKYIVRLSIPFYYEIEALDEAEAERMAYANLEDEIDRGNPQDWQAKLVEIKPA